MKSLLSRIFLTFIVGAMVSSLAFAKTKRDTVTFTQDVSVNGSVVKAGRYDVSFNDETKELSILRNGKVVAHMTGRIEQRSSKASQTQVKTATTNGAVEFIGVAFGGSDKDIMVEGRSDSARN